MLVSCHVALSWYSGTKIICMELAMCSDLKTVNSCLHSRLCYFINTGIVATLRFTFPVMWRSTSSKHTSRMENMLKCRIYRHGPHDVFFDTDEVLCRTRNVSELLDLKSRRAIQNIDCLNSLVRISSENRTVRQNDRSHSHGQSFDGSFNRSCASKLFYNWNASATLEK